MRKNIQHIFMACVILTASFSLRLPLLFRDNPRPILIWSTSPAHIRMNWDVPANGSLDCANTQLSYDLEDDVWQGTYEI